MSVSSNLSNILIEGNSFNVGSPTTHNYSYLSDVATTGDCNIQNNFFAGIEESLSSVIIDLTDCSCNISNNTFVRGDNFILAYVRNSGTLDHRIVDNTFDGYTVDGSSDALVLGLTNSSQYYANKNQIIYIPVSVGVGSSLNDNTTGPSAGVRYSTADVVTTGFTTYFQGLWVNTSTEIYAANISLNELLPDGVSIIEMRQGVYGTNNGGGATIGAASFVNFIISSTETNRANYVSGDDSILDAKKLSGGTYTGNTSHTTSYSLFNNITAILLGTQYFTASISGDDKFTVTKDKMISLNWQQQVVLGTAGDGFTFSFSPIVVKCIW